MLPIHQITDSIFQFRELDHPLYSRPDSAVKNSVILNCHRPVKDKQRQRKTSDVRNQWGGYKEYVEMAFHIFSLFPESKALRRKEEEWPGCPKWLRRSSADLSCGDSRQAALPLPWSDRSIHPAALKCWTPGLIPRGFSAELFWLNLSAAHRNVISWWEPFAFCPSSSVGKWSHFHLWLMNQIFQH